MAKKVVIRIEPQHFVLDANDDFVVGCHHIKEALDVSGWSFEQLQHVMSSLHNVGKSKAEVVEVNV